MWHRIVAASAGVFGFIATVSAGDLDQKTEAAPGSPAPQVSWTGFYVGANGGYGLSARHPDMRIVDEATNSTDRLDAAQTGGGFGGVQVGHNWQGFLDPGLVLGIEADLEYAGIGGTLKPSPGAPFEARTNLNAFGTLRGRAGYAWDHALFYATAGVAFGDVESTVLYKDSLGQSFSLDSSSTRAGYAAGGGVGLTLTPNWSLKVEYQFLRLESLSAIGTFAGSAVTDALRTSDPGYDTHTIRAGLNYHTQASYQPLK
jgi:outer membrane immunogenic protein